MEGERACASGKGSCALKWVVVEGEPTGERWPSSGTTCTVSRSVVTLVCAFPLIFLVRNSILYNEMAFDWVVS